MEKSELTALIVRAQAGDQGAMEEVLRIAHTSVSYQCRKLLRDPQDAEDMTQEVLLTVYTKLDSLKAPEAFWGWLNQTTANRCVNALKRSHVELQFAEDEEGHSVLDNLEEADEQQVPDKALDNAETTRMIEEIVDGLPEAQRVCTLMYYYDEMSVKDIAAALGVPENTVKSRLNYARKAVKEKVLDYEKKGVKLYGLSPLPFLLFFLLHAAEETADSAAADAMAKKAMEMGAAAAAGGTAAAGTAASTGGTAAGETSAAAKGAAETALAHAAGGLSTKLIAGALAGLLLVCGIGAAVVLATQNAEEPGSTAAVTETASVEAEPEEAESLGTTPDGWPLDPRWADLQPGETALQYRDVFIKSGMTLGEAMEAMDRSECEFATSFEASLDDERTCSGDGSAGSTSFFVTHYWPDTAFNICYLEQLPGEPGTTYRLRDCPIYAVFPAIAILGGSVPDEVVTRIGPFVQFKTMDLETIQGVMETALAGMGAELETSKTTHNGVPVVDYHYDYLRYFSWSGYKLCSPGREDGFWSDAHFEVEADTGKVFELGAPYFDRHYREDPLIWVPEE